MTLLSIAAAGLLAPMFALQSAGNTIIAIENDNPETWQVEYPRLIQPQVTEYRKCLNLSDRYINGEANFEDQHRTDVPRCAAIRQENVAAANALLADAKTTLSPTEVETLFDRIGLIHIARGHDLDMQFTQRLARAEQAQENFEENKPEPVVVELTDPAVVKIRRTAPENTEQAGTQ
ncbi:hypothetical protein [Erythrobacter sp. MTPC3]|uniref:hypothetical protein n=1 Tax=Erythrobacter sp. MTPC3 TaxID=3056564 RepID=UPI0036F305E8